MKGFVFETRYKGRCVSVDVMEAEYEFEAERDMAELNNDRLDVELIEEKEIIKEVGTV